MAILRPTNSFLGFFSTLFDICSRAKIKIPGIQKISIGSRRSKPTMARNEKSMPTSSSPPCISFPDLLLVGGAFAKGGAGEVRGGVYFGIDVAVKLVNRKENEEEHARFLAKLAEETRLQCLCGRHANILPLLAFNVSDGDQPLSLIMPRMVTSVFDLIHKPTVPVGFAPGSDYAALSEGRRLPLRRRLVMLQELASALSYLHGHCKVVHGDIKSHNLLLDPNGCLKLSDFGLSRPVASASSAVEGGEEDGEVEGSLPWMAPECVLGEEAIDDETSEGRSEDAREHLLFARDVFSFSVVIVEVVTGQLPYKDMKPQAIMRFLSRGKRLKLRPPLFLASEGGASRVEGTGDGPPCPPLGPPLGPGPNRLEPIQPQGHSPGPDAAAFDRLQALYDSCGAQNPKTRPSFFRRSSNSSGPGFDDDSIVAVTKALASSSCLAGFCLAGAIAGARVPVAPPLLPQPPPPPAPPAPSAPPAVAKSSPARPPPLPTSSTSSAPSTQSSGAVTNTSPGWRRLSWWSSAGREVLSAGSESAQTFISSTAAFLGSTDDAIARQQSRQRGMQRRRWSSGAVDGAEKTAALGAAAAATTASKNSAPRTAPQTAALAALSAEDAELALNLLQAERQKQKEEESSKTGDGSGGGGGGLGGAAASSAGDDTSQAPSEAAFRRLSAHFGKGGGK